MNTITQADVALRIFCTMLSLDPKLDLYPEFGEKQIRNAFWLAETFMKVAKEVDPPRTPNPNVVAPPNR